VQGCAGDRNVENVENIVIKQQRVGKGEEERKGSLLSGIERPLPIGDNAVQTDLPGRSASFWKPGFGFRHHPWVGFRDPFSCEIDFAPPRSLASNHLYYEPTPVSDASMIHTSLLCGPCSHLTLQLEAFNFLRFVPNYGICLTGGRIHPVSYQIG